MSDPEAAGSLPGLSIDAAGAVSALIVAIDEAVEAQHDLEQKLRCACGVNNTDFRALLLIFRFGRRRLPVRPADLTKGLGISSGATTQVISRLRQARLIDRAPHPHDARTGILTLSPTAAQRLAAATHAIRTDLDTIIATLNEHEESRMIALLGQVRDAFLAHTTLATTASPT